MDPHRILGVPHDATEDEVTDAYRTLAKRFHPDLNPGAAEDMRELNAAYAELRRRGFRRRTRFTAPPGPAPGAWLPPQIRHRLGRELVIALHPQEPVLVVADAASWDSLNVRLVVTDRRLLWLRDDAIVDRVRRMGFNSIAAVDARIARGRRRGELRVKPKDGRRLAFAEIRSELLDDALWVIRPRLRGARTSAR
jgi:DnaJ domain